MRPRFRDQLVSEEIVNSGIADVPVLALLFEQRQECLFINRLAKFPKQAPEIVIVPGARAIPASGRELLVRLQERTQLLRHDFGQRVAGDFYGQPFFIAMDQIARVRRQDHQFILGHFDLDPAKRRGMPGELNVKGERFLTMRVRVSFFVLSYGNLKRSLFEQKTPGGLTGGFHRRQKFFAFRRFDR